MSVIGNPISDSVYREFINRANHLSNPKKDAKTVQALNDRSFWVSLMSGVEIKDDPVVAKNHILWGGVKQYRGWQETSTGRIHEFTDRQGYLNDPDKGKRPIPGITDFSIDTFNTYGTLRRASVLFTCWTLRDLELYEKLYMRPGYHVLLQWGHQVYLDNDGELLTAGDMNSVLDYSKFFYESNADQVEDEIYGLKKATNHNYDGFLGVVENFQWTLGQNGEYLCKTVLISKGDILQSLKTLLYSKNTSETKKVGLSSSVLYNVLDLIKNSNITEVLEDVKKYLSEEINVREDFNRVVSVGVYVNSEEGRDYNPVRYVPLHFILDLLRQNLINVSNQSKYVDIHTVPGLSPYLTYANHISANPYTCILPKPPANKNLDAIEGRKAVIGQNTEPQVLRKIINNVGDPEDILNIWVNAEWVLELLDELPNDVDMYNFIEQNLLKGISKALGGINDFRLEFKEYHVENNKSYKNTYFIVDRNHRLNTTSFKGKDIPITGLRTTVSHIALSSEIPTELASMIAISAQARSSAIGLNSSSFLKWNENIVDRFATEKTVNLELNETTVYKDAIEELTGLIVQFRDRNTLNKANLKTSESIYSQVASKDIHDVSVHPSTPPGMIPFAISLTIDGISSLKIGECFKIEEGILPEKQQKYTGFIITGLSNRIERGKWVTVVKGQTVVLEGIRSENGPKVFETKEREVDEELSRELDEQDKGTITSGKGNKSPMSKFTNDLVEDAVIMIKSAEGFSKTAYWDVNNWRIGYGSDTITYSSSSIVRLPNLKTAPKPLYIVTEELATRDLRRRLIYEFIPEARKTVTELEANWITLPHTTKLVLIDCAYNYGTLWKSIARAGIKGPSTLKAELLRRYNLGTSQTPSRRIFEIKILKQ